MPEDPGRYRPTVHYDRGGTTVTDTYVRTTRGDFPIEELSELHRSLPYPHPGRTMAVFLAGLELILAVPVAVALRSMVAFAVGVVVAVCVGIGAIMDGHRSPDWFAIKGRFRGEEVTIFSTRDEGEFERVRLSLVRAWDAWRAASY
jgi:hypothetical protein